MAVIPNTCGKYGRNCARMDSCIRRRCAMKGSTSLFWPCVLVMAVLGSSLLGGCPTSGGEDAGTTVAGATQGAPGAKGDTGAQGPQGAQGDPGPQGSAGPQGAPGIDGLNGTNGTNGLDGADGQLRIYG